MSASSSQQTCERQDSSFQGLGNTLDQHSIHAKGSNAIVPAHLGLLQPCGSVQLRETFAMNNTRREGGSQSVPPKDPYRHHRPYLHHESPENTRAFWEPYFMNQSRQPDVHEHIHIRSKTTAVIGDVGESETPKSSVYRYTTVEDSCCVFGNVSAAAAPAIFGSSGRGDREEMMAFQPVSHSKNNVNARSPFGDRDFSNAPYLSHVHLVQNPTIPSPGVSSSRNRNRAEH